MRDLNKVTLIGTVSKDISTATSQKGLAIANIPIQTAQSRQNGSDIVTYHTILCFGELAELASTFKVGDRVMAEGSIQNDSYEVDGQKRRVTKVKASVLAKLQTVAEDNMGGSKKEESSENFPHGETRNSSGFPYFDAEREVTFEKPTEGDKGCSPVVTKSNVHFTCRWSDPNNPFKGGIVFGLNDGEKDWKQVGTIESTANIPF
tara:strand:- start:160 stop:774 length:615 start_codon:yes stop_codon:yes gene_type:complete